MATRIQLRRDTAANWTSTNPTLAQGELGVETDTDQLKIGNGVDDWQTLGYWSSGGGLQPGDNITELSNNAGYITGYTVTQGDVTAHEAALTIGNSQVTGLGSAALVSSSSFATSTQGSKADTALQAGDDVSDLNNDAGYITSSAIANFETTSQLNARDTANRNVDNHTNGTTNKVFTTANQTKLNGITALADVTTTAKVGAAIHSATAKTTPVDADTMGLIDSAASNAMKKVSWANIKATLKTYFDSLYASKLEPIHEQIALSGYDQVITTGDKKGILRVTRSGNITGFVIDCDPNNKPTVKIEVDLKKINRSTGVATTLLSTKAEIAISGTTGAGTISGTQAVSVGDLLIVNVDQATDGKFLQATITNTPTS